MKKTTLTIVTIAMLALHGCKYSDSCGGGPVAPEQQSYEKSSSGDPQLPYMKPWWK